MRPDRRLAIAQIRTETPALGLTQAGRAVSQARKGSAGGGEGYRRVKPALPVALGAFGILLLILFADPSGVLPALRSFDARLLPLLLSLAVVDYGLRFWRWRLLVTYSVGRAPPLGADAAMFLASNTLLLTPARAGDLTRSLWARHLFGTPVARTAPIPLLERVADGFVMATLASLGAFVFGAPVIAGVAGLGLAVAGMALLPSRRAGSALVLLLSKTAGERVAGHVAAFFESLRALWKPGPLKLAFGFGFVAWGIECLMFFIVLAGLGLAATPMLAAKAAFIYPLATLAGTLSLLPGGLGVAEASTAGLTGSLTQATAATAVAAAVLIRLAILGFGVVSGIPGLIYISRRGGAITPEAAAGAAGLGTDA